MIMCVCEKNRKRKCKVLLEQRCSEPGNSDGGKRSLVCSLEKLNELE